MRVFAGPNGSGKSTIINEVKQTKIQGKFVDFGTYINADDIAEELHNGVCRLQKFDTKASSDEFREIALASGLVNDEFTVEQFLNCYTLINNEITLLVPDLAERLAQIVSDFLRKKLLIERKKFSFETVFSHSSKLDIMRLAVDAGYKVYLYFVSTESPEINKYRVEVRVRHGGHNVHPEKIRQRYYRSLDLLFKAAQLSYQAFFIDNSTDVSEGGRSTKWFAHFKVIKGKKIWDDVDVREVPEWFKIYYSAKVPKRRSARK